VSTRRKLIFEDDRIRRYQVFGDTGQPIGIDEETVPTPEMVNSATLRNRLLQALAANVAHLAKTTTTTAEDKAHLRLVTQELTALIRLMLEQLKTIDGT